jgi:hypothetical protein
MAQIRCNCLQQPVGQIVLARSSARPVCIMVEGKVNESFGPTLDQKAYNALVKEAGRVFPQVKLTHVEKLPLIVATKNKQKEISDLVKRLLAMKKRNPDADSEALERALDAMIDALCGVIEDGHAPSPRSKTEARMRNDAGNTERLLGPASSMWSPANDEGVSISWFL